jgi:hypothetical protein
VDELVARGAAGSAARLRGPPLLAGPRLLLARAFWLAVFFVAVGLLAASIPGRWALAAREAAGAADALARSGLTVGAYAGAKVAADIALAVVSGAVGLLIFARRAREPMALLVAVMLVALGQLGNRDALAAAPAGVQLLVGFVYTVAWTSFSLFFYLFPDGRFLPRWTRWLALLAVLVNFYPQSPAPAAIQFLGLIPFAVAIPVQVYRYLRVSTAVERQQTKLVVLGMAGFLAGYLVFAVVWSFLPGFNERGSLLYLISYAAGILAFLLIPLSLGAAILRYRLYDVDLVIRRTLIYGALTALLAGVYFGGVALAQALLRPFTGAGNDLAIVVTTLGIAALALPLRRAVQGFIDRSFFHRKYDAAKTMAAFSARPR